MSTRKQPVWTILGMCLVMAGLASALEANAVDDLLRQTHRGAREDRVASGWLESFPTWVASHTSKNQFLVMHLPFEHVDNRGRITARPLRGETRPFRVRDVNARGELSIRTMTPDRVDGDGRPQYRDISQDSWMPVRSCPPDSLFHVYMTQQHEDVNQIVGFGVWLYAQRQNNLANRVLTIAHSQSPALAALIEAYICEKEGWTKPEDGLQHWTFWDADRQRENRILVTPAEAERLTAEREREAQAAWREIVTARGDHQGRPPRRRPPTKSLALVDWELRQYRIAYKDTAFIANNRNLTQIEAISDSISDDRANITTALEQARAMPAENQREITARGDAFEAILRVNPADPTLMNEVAMAWYNGGGIHAHGNNCDNTAALRNAITHFEKLIEMFPYNTNYLFHLGRCWQALQNSSKAGPLYERIIEVDGTTGMGPQARAFMRNMERADANRR
jgi:tetratricopeptide (TPR) repeat protein